MTTSKWERVDFQQFIKEFGVDFVIKNAPIVLYSKKDKEHEAYNSLVILFFIACGLIIYISLSLFFIDVYFSIIVFITVITFTIALESILIINYIKSNVFIRPIECWFEIYKNNDYYCISFYIIFTGKCHPNKAKSIIFKLYQEEVLNDTIDITQIEVYFKFNQKEPKKIENFGYFFEYGKGVPFKSEVINHNSWKFFPFELSKNKNYITIANWAHQYEWLNDLEFDFNKLYEHAPWIIKRWNYSNIKPLTDDFKKKINWPLRYISSTPKLKPWKEDLKNQIYKPQKPYWENKIINDAIKNVIGDEYRVERLKDLKFDLFEVKAYFRELKL